MELTFRELVKMVHPDSNPNITNPSEKMNDIMLNRGNSRALWNLAVRWGLVGGTENEHESVRSNVRISIQSDNVWDTGFRQNVTRRSYWETYWEV